MNFQELNPELLREAPPVMPWVKFAEWIQMDDELQVVRGWIDRGYLPSIKIGKRLMINIELFKQQLTDSE